LLSYRWEESTQGPPRKYYTITEKGKEVLKELEITWNNLIEAVDSIMKNN
jgi:PadR family transcriptional regulator PadR